MAEDQGDKIVVKEAVKKLENSPKVLINGEEFTACSDHDLAASSNSEEEHDHKQSIRSPSPAESHSDNDSRELLEEFHPPSDELKEKIRSQVELYLSDDNLARDAFLLKHVRRNKEGFVNLKLITSFKRVKSLTKDYRVVAEALKDSAKLTLNSENTKVKRNEPLRSELMERNPGRTVVVSKIDKPTFEHVSEMFSKCGEIVLIRIIRPGKAVPADIKSYVSKFPEIESETFAVIEFETMAAAARACSELSKDGGMKVVEMGKGGRKKEKKPKLKDRDVDSVPESDEEHDEKTKRKRNRGKKNKNKRVAELAGGSTDESLSTTSSCSSDTDGSYNPFSSCRRRYRSSPGASSSSPKDSPQNSPRMVRKELPGITGQWRSPQSSPEPTRKHKTDVSPAKEGSNSAPNSPWSQRRKTTSPKPSGHSPLVDSGPVKHRMIQLEGIERLPRGPDGTKGFHSGMGRGQPLIVVA